MTSPSSGGKTVVADVDGAGAELAELRALRVTVVGVLREWGSWMNEAVGPDWQDQVCQDHPLIELFDGLVGVRSE